MKKQLFWAFAGLTSFTVSLVVLAPLPVIAQQMMKLNPGLEFAGVSGSLWKGRVQRLTTPQAVISDLNWTLAPKKLMSGYLAADLEAEVKTTEVRGQCGISIGKTLHCSPLRVELDAKNINQLAPKGVYIPVELEGLITADLDDITWDRVKVPVANGRVSWEDGKVVNPVKMELGGRYIANIEAGKDDGALAVELLSEEATVVLDGEINVEPEGGYALELSVKAANDAPDTVGAALEMVGAVQTNGSVRIIHRGALSLPKESSSSQVEAVSKK